jgi:predicted dehydrogenase
MNYNEGYTVFLDCSDRDYFHFEIDIQGDKGRITIGNGIQRYYVKAESPYYENFNSLLEKPFPIYEKKPFFEILIESLVKYLKTGEIPESTGETALGSLKHIMAIYKSAVNNKKITYPIKITNHPFDKISEEVNCN